MIFQREKALAKFTTLKGHEIEIITPSLGRLSALVEFTNRLIKEDTFLNLTGAPVKPAGEKQWLNGVLKDISTGRSFYIWAIHQDRIIGSLSLTKTKTRSAHVAELGIMVDRDFRREGIGQFLIEFGLKEAKKRFFSIVTLDCFADNLPALTLYRKLGFKEYGRLPKALFRQDKYSDEIKMYKVLDNLFV